MRFKICFVLIIIGGLHPKPRVHVGGKSLPIKGLEPNEKFIDPIGFIKYLFVSHGPFVPAFALRKSRTENARQKEHQ